MMHPRHVLVDLPKDRRPELYCFGLAAKEAKRGAFHLLGKSKLCSRKNAHRCCRILRCGKPSCTGPEVDCRKLLTDLSGPGFDVVQTIVAHGSATPLMLPSPRSLELSKERVNFVITQGVEQIQQPREVARLSAWARPSTRRRRTSAGRGPGSACLFSARLWLRRSTMAPLNSQPAATILQTESSRRSTTTDEKCHPQPRHRSAA